MQKPKTLKYIGSICFFVASLILGVSHFIHDSILRLKHTSLMDTIDSIAYKIFGSGIRANSICGWDYGFLFAALIVIACLFVIIGFLTQKSRSITIGALIGIVTQCLSSLRLLYSIEWLFFMEKWIYRRSLFTNLTAGGSVLLLYESILALFFIALLLCSLDLSHSRMYGIIGAVLILARLIPAGFIGGTGYGAPQKFDLSFWAIVISVLFAVGSILLGIFFAQFAVIKPDEHIYSIEGATKIDKIVRLKGLLDMGAITQEEFDTKKKEIIGK